MIQEMIKKFEACYTSTMTVKVNEPQPGSPFVGTHWVVKYQDVPCRIGQKSLNVTTKDNVATTTYVTALYCSRDLIIPAGSRVIVTDPNGRTQQYDRTSEAFHAYLTHQEILLSREVEA
ncbi:MAG: hypothetical protein Q4A55_06660 [Aerococcus sp.]|nr:hypothetical protein [Aerococcus sp.]